MQGRLIPKPFSIYIITNLYLYLRFTHGFTYSWNMLKCNSMYSKVAICKTCYQRVLDVQLKMEPIDACVYCLVTHLKHKAQDQIFANRLLEKNLADLGEAYQDCIELLNKQTKELMARRIDPNSLIG